MASLEEREGNESVGVVYDYQDSVVLVSLNSAWRKVTTIQPVFHTSGPFDEVYSRLYEMNLEFTLFRLKDYCLQHGPMDPLVNPGARKANPWAEKSKCSVL